MAKKAGSNPPKAVRKNGPTPTAQPQPTAETAPAASPASSNGVPVVGIGASAGGLEAVTELLKHLPSVTGMAFVVIQHLDPAHASQLPAILARKSPLPVNEVHGLTPIKPDQVYVIPASHNLRIEKGVLQTVPRVTDAGMRNMAVDDFMESLAVDLGNRAFGIILSGTGSDGTIGLRAIKAEGGITFAQEPSSAKFDGMPRSAIAADGVDFVLTPEEIAHRLAALANHAYVHQVADAEPPPESSISPAGDLPQIFNLLRAATGVDFTHYKHNTILRRMERRMALHGIETLTDYARMLRRDRAEAKILGQELLINVTAFFREPEKYDVLREHAFPTLLEHRAPEEAIRVWVPGCSTGEEAYSLAISLTEFLEAQHASFNIQIFATDLSEPVIERARSGVYPASALGGVSPQRLQRFFIKRDHIYQVSQAIRSVCVFAKQDLTKDPPFSKIDLVSCCNLLIYLGTTLQKKALSLFHYALKPGGILVLGSSESIGAYADAFHTIDRKQRVYSKKRGSPPPLAGFSSASQPTGRTEQHLPSEGVLPVRSIEKYVDRMLLAEYAPAGVIVDDSLRVLQVRGDTSPFLHLPPGEPTTDLTKLVRPGLLVALKAAIRKARQQNSAVKEKALRLRDNGQMRVVDLQVSPIRDPGGQEQCFLILFEDPKRNGADSPAPAKGKQRAQTPPPRAAEEIAHLEQELKATREYLQSIIESQEAATEELRSANEEAQATNEELDTAKEELQASNEELNTVNDELRARNLEQSTLNSDLRKLLESINVPLVMVGRNLHIRWFTPAMEPLLNLLPTDQGRPITDLQSSAIPNFRQLLEDAISGQQSRSIELESPTGRWLSLRILPYHGVDNAIEGAIATLIDIDDLKRARDFAEAVVAVVREPFLVLDAGLRVRTANQSFYETFRLQSRDTEGQLIYKIGNGQWNNPRLKQLLEDVLPKQSWMKDFEVQQNYPGLGLRTMLLQAREIRQGDERMILVAIEDITQMRQSAAELYKTNEDLKQFTYAASHDLQEPIRTIVTYTDLLSRRFGKDLGEDGGKFIHFAVEAAERLEALIAGLREFWQVSERVEEKHTQVDCNQVLRTVLLSLEEAVAESGAVVTAHSLPVVVAAETPLLQLFQNLIANAIKYRSAKPPRIQVSAVKHDSEWVFAVEDNGLGIDPKYASEVFGVFKRLHPRSRYPGTGIGLAICEKIVHRYGGRIWVEPALPTGSIFKFTLPA